MKQTGFFALFLILSAFMLSGCAGQDVAWEEKSYTPALPVEQLVVDVRDRAVQVSLSEDEQLHITYSQSGKEFYEISVSDAGVLTMTGASEKAWTDYVGTKPDAANRKILLQIPDDTFKNLTICTTNEDITLPALSVAGSVTLSCNGGDIRFARLSVEAALSLAAKNGDISGTVVGGYDDFSMRTSVKKGENNLPERKDGGEKTLIADCNNGDIDIAFTK